MSHNPENTECHQKYFSHRNGHCCCTCPQTMTFSVDKEALARANEQKTDCGCKLDVDQEHYCEQEADQTSEPLFGNTHHTSPYDPVCQQTKDDHTRIFAEAEKLAMPKDCGWEESARVVKLSDLREILTHVV